MNPDENLAPASGGNAPPIALAGRYRGFISYSQQDMIWARRLQRWLETYRVPAGVAGGMTPDRRLGLFFRDQDDMAAAADIREIVEPLIRP